MSLWLSKLLRQPIFYVWVGFILLGAIYAVTTPLFEASDELWHYPLVQHLSRGGALPVQDPRNVGPWRQEASQPPLYYYLMGWATAWIDTTDMPQVRWLNPHVDNGVITPDGNINLAIHTEAERWPWQGTVLAVRFVRLLSVLMGAGTVVFTYLLASEFFEDTLSRLMTAAFVAFTPMFVFISGAVNNDNLASLLSAAILFLLVHFVRHPGWGGFNRFGTRAGLAACLTLGVLLGFAALTKQSALGLFPLTGLTLIVLSFQESGARSQESAVKSHLSFSIRHAKRSFLLLHCSLVFLPALLIPAGWYYRNLGLYGDLLGWSAFIAVLGKRAAPASLLQLWGERESFTRSYWGLFGGVNVPMSDWIYTALNLIALAALIGVVVFVVKSLFGPARRLAAGPRLDTLRDSIKDWFPYALLLGQLGLITYGLIQWATVTWSSQGRLVFSGISAIAVIAVLGLRTLTPVRFRPWVLGPIMIFMGAITAAAPFAFIVPRYVDPPPLTNAQLATLPHRLDVDFGALNFPAEMRLLGYALESDTVRPGGSLTLTLYWQSLVAMDRDWSVFIHLVDEAQVIVAHRDVYPGVGLMPTRKWQVGQTLADRYVLSVPETTYAPGKAQIEVGLYDYNTNDRLLIASENSPEAGQDALTLAPVTLAANPGELPNPQSINFGGQVELLGYAMDRRELKAGDTLQLTLHWRSLKPLTVNYSVFAHVRGQGESLWGQQDSWPLAGAAPTTTWQVGQLVTETRLLTLKPETTPGVYDVEVGLYDEKGVRLQRILPDGQLTDNFVYLSQIRVQP